MTTRLSSEERKQAIVEAALPLFAEKGASAVTTKEIAAAAGVSEALLYRHFPSKDAIYVAIQHTCLNQESAASVNALPDSTATLIMAVYLLMKGILEPPKAAGDRPRHMCRLLMRSLLEDGAFIRESMAIAATPWVEKLQRCWESAKASGELVERAGPPRCTLWFAHHLAVKLCQDDLVDPPVVDFPVEREQLFDEAVRFSLLGIGLTPQAIEKHYHPEAFALMGGAKL